MTKRLPTHDELVEWGALRKVSRINHREFVHDGVRYFVGWSSGRHKGDFSGWITYKSKLEWTKV